MSFRITYKVKKLFKKCDSRHGVVGTVFIRNEWEKENFCKKRQTFFGEVGGVVRMT